MAIFYTAIQKSGIHREGQWLREDGVESDPLVLAPGIQNVLTVLDLCWFLTDLTLSTALILIPALVFLNKIAQLDYLE